MSNQAIAPEDEKIMTKIKLQKRHRIVVKTDISHFHIISQLSAVYVWFN